MNQPVLRAIGIPWYADADTWRQAKAIMAEPGTFHPTYIEWRNSAEQGEKRYRRQGFITVKAYIDPSTFPDWCRLRGLDIDAKARVEYANLIAYQEASGTH